MTLADLETQLAPCFSETTRKDLKTAVRVLARALDCPDPAHCALDHVNRPLPHFIGLWKTISPPQAQAHDRSNRIRCGTRKTCSVDCFGTRTRNSCSRSCPRSPSTV